MMAINFKYAWFQILLCVSLVLMTIQNVINIVQGSIRGIQQDGYVSYIGVPYASVNDEDSGRFKGPGIAPVWSGIRESREPHCSSTSPVEHCVQLDVHVPISGSQMPILVWVKGGSGHYHPGQLVSQGIIVVVVRHRLGPFGFLCSKKDKISGNVGIKDVLQALRWVRDNIVAFNGNPHRVVIGGQSFGAAMVEALMLIQTSRELYHGAILQSGSILCPWSTNFDAEDRADALRKRINVSDDMEPSIVKTETVKLGTEAEDIDFSYLPFGICVERPYKNVEAIIVESPFNLLLKGKMVVVPLLMGYNNNEAYVFASILKEAKIIPQIARNMTVVIPEEIQNLGARELTQITKQIKDMYFAENINMTALLSYHRDAYFLSHIHRSLLFHAATHRPVYYYQFSYSGNIGVEPTPGVRKTGAAHSDELAYIFPNNGKNLEDEDGVVQKHLIRLWANFIKHLNPTPEKGSSTMWEQTGAHHPRILDINTELEMMEFPHASSTQMFEDIYEKYYYTRKPNSAAM